MTPRSTPRTAAGLLALAVGLAALPQAAAAQEGPPGRFDFDTADANGDGQITPEELDALRAARVGALDADGDGFLTAEELTAFQRAEAEARIEARVARMIEQMDADGDGRLSAAEMAEGREAGRAAGLFRRADANDDGAISREEYETARERMAEGRHERRGQRGRR